MLLAVALPPFLKVVLGFGFVIFIHEFGHFLFARLNGVYVEKFAIGFDYPFALASWRGKSGTEYVLGALPVGGYVKMLGQNELPGEIENNPRLQRPDSFLSKTVWQRTSIIAAGVIFNFLSAFALCYFAFGVGFSVSPPAVGSVGFDSLEAGLRPGDEILAIAGKDVDSWEDIFVNYATQDPGATVEFLVERFGNERLLELPIQRDPTQDINFPDFGRPVSTRVRTVAEPSAAFEAGLQPGDWLEAVDGEEIVSWSQFTDLIRRRAETKTSIRVRREVEGVETTVELTATPSSRTPDDVPARTLGIVPDDPAVIGFVDPEGPAAPLGGQVGDRVVSVEGRPVDNWYDLWRIVSWELPEHAPVRLGLDRGGEQVAVTVRQEPAQNWGTGIHGLSTLGFAGEAPDELVIGGVEAGSPASKAKLQSGDVIEQFTVQVDDRKGGKEDLTVESPNWETLQYALNSMESDRVALRVRRGADQRLDLELDAVDAGHDVRIGFLGVGPLVVKETIQLGWGEAVGAALVKPFQILDQFIVGLKAMFLGKLSTKMLSGPVGIIQAMHTYAEEGTGDLLLFLALLSVNLAIVNFLPIPITDGGHFMFLMYEKFKGRRMDDDLYNRFQWAGLVFILMVFVFATFNDVGRLLGF